MTPAARLQAAIEMLDEVIASARDDGPPADSIVTRYFKHRRYAGSKDRRAVRELVFRAIRRSAERPASGRAAMLGLAQDDPELARAVRRAARARAVAMAKRAAPAASCVPDWLQTELSPLVGEDEWPALLDRAPLDLRVNIARASRDEMLDAIRRRRADAAQPLGHSPARRQPGRRSSGVRRPGWSRCRTRAAS